MSAAELIPLMPHLSIAAAAIAVIVLVAVQRNHRVALGLTIAGLAGAIVSASVTGTQQSRLANGLLVADGYAQFFIIIIAAAVILISLLAYDYWKKRTSVPEEFYILLLLATLGSTVLVSSSHFATLFLGLEILSVALYGIIAYRRDDCLSIEAGIKYLVLAGASSAFLLFGMALVYAQLGTMGFAELAAAAQQQDTMSLPLGTGLALILVGIGFKLAVVPFHLWTPDVYEGAPAPSTAFIATVSKGTVFALFARLFATFHASSQPLEAMFVFFAIASMFTGNLLALRQRRVKRMLAYSSIAHMGYLLVAFVAGPPLAIRAIALYLVAYFLSMISAFGVVAALSPLPRDADGLRDFRQLAWRRPWLATAFTAALFSLAGVPLTAGFLGKFQVLAAGVDAQRWLLLVLMVANSAIAVYYYLRVIAVMYQKPQGGAAHAADLNTRSQVLPTLSFASGLAIFSLSLLLLGLGVYPGPLLELIRTLTAVG